MKEELVKAWLNAMYGLGNVREAIKITSGVLSTAEGKKALIEAFGNAAVASMASKIVGLIHKEGEEKILIDNFEGSFVCPSCGGKAFRVVSAKNEGHVKCKGDGCAYQAPFAMQTHWWSEP